MKPTILILFVIFIIFLVACGNMQSVPGLPTDNSPVTSPIDVLQATPFTTDEPFSLSPRGKSYLNKMVLLEPEDQISWNIKNGKLLIGCDEGMQQWLQYREILFFFFPEKYESVIRSITHIAVNESVNVIPPVAFEKLPYVESVELKEGLLVIGGDSFYGCVSLKEVIVPSSVIKIEMGAFLDCTSLEAILFSSTLKTMESYIIDGCTSLKEVRIPESVKMIKEDGLFTEGAQRIIFEGTVEKIYDQGFSVMTELRQIVFLEGPPLSYYGELTSYGMRIEGISGIGHTNATVYYLRKNKQLWAPNGETEWVGRPLVEIDSLDDLPPLN